MGNIELFLKITGGLLLFVHLASLQLTTDSPGRTIDKGWLRGLAKNTAGIQDLPVTEDDMSDSSSGTPSGYTEIHTEEELNVISHSGNESHNFNPNGTTTDTDILHDLNSTTTDSNLSQIIQTRNENSTTTPPTTTAVIYANTSTGSPDVANPTDLQSTTSAPQTNATREPTTKLTNSTESNTTTAGTNTTTPAINVTSTSISPSTSLPPETAETSTVTVTSTALGTPGLANKADKDAALGSSSDRGFASDPPKNKRYVEWATVLGTMVAVSVIGLVAFIILRSRRYKGFSHRKLVEEYPSDPVLRLDNSEPLDLNFGGSGHYNPGLQGDSIQMTNFPGRH